VLREYLLSTLALVMSGSTASVAVLCSGKSNDVLGNGHMLFMEKNGLQIAEQVIKPWISKIRA
jgi:hypothetical protein